MTGLITSMSFPISGSAARSAVEALTVQTPLPPADAAACRLAAAVARGDEAAFRELYDRYHDRLFRLALVLGHGDEPLAGETAQSVFVTAAAKLRCVESEAHLWHWLARVTRQQLARARRQQQDDTVIGVAELPDCTPEHELDSVLEENLDAALLTLAGDERQLLEWFYFDKLSHKEIAAQLRATPKAVSSRLERARARLRAVLMRTLSHEN